MALLGERILLGVTGGIAAYKAADLVRRLKQAGAEVRVVMSESAQQFITATTFQALSGQPVRSSLWDAQAEAAMGHIELARWATKVLIAPASANCMARLASGQANDLLSTLCLVTTAPIYLAPAMNQAMWANAATRANADTLRARDMVLLGPADGVQACGEVGEGRMLEPEAIVQALGSGAGPWQGKKVLITAGPSYEDIDPVRFIGNRSSGKMGFALAQAAHALGAQVVLIAGPVALRSPQGVQRIDVRSAAHMHAAVFAHLDGCDVFIAAAAVADYRPVQLSTQKIKKTPADLHLTLERTDDILADVAQSTIRPKWVIGFAAETEHLIDYAQKKLWAKNLDMMAANDVSATGIGFESDENALLVLTRTEQITIAKGPKSQVAQTLLTLIEKMFGESNGHGHHN